MKYISPLLLMIGLIGLQSIMAQPVITNVLPAPGTILKPHGTINFSCTVTGPNPVTYVDFIIPLAYDYDNILPDNLWESGVATQSGNIWTASWVNANMPLGNFRLVVIATDNASNYTFDTVMIHVANDQWAVNLGTNTTYDTVGSVGIGTNNTQGYMLAVNGTAIFTKLMVQLNGTWPDHVFGKGYQLPSLDQVARAIAVDHHLPDLPAADSIAGRGIDMGVSDALLLKKIEEMTLYLIGHDRELSRWSKKLEAREERIRRLELSMEVPVTTTAGKKTRRVVKATGRAPHV